MTLAPAERRQLVAITLGALAVFAVIRLLPTGTNLSHMDFRVTAKNSIDFATRSIRSSFPWLRRRRR